MRKYQKFEHCNVTAFEELLSDFAWSLVYRHAKRSAG